MRALVNYGYDQGGNKERPRCAPSDRLIPTTTLPPSTKASDGGDSAFLPKAAQAKVVSNQSVKNVQQHECGNQCREGERPKKQKLYRSVHCLIMTATLDLGKGEGNH